MLRNYEDDRDYNKRPCYNPQEPAHRMQAATEEQVLRLKRQCLDAPEPAIYIEPSGYDQPLGVMRSHNNTSLDAPDPQTKPLMSMAQEFLDSNNKVLLLMGDPGSGKTVFVKQLERKLWGQYNGPNDPIPILVNLPEFANTASDFLRRVLQSRGFRPEHIQFLRPRGRQFILICDGYDEAQVQGNIYNQNKFNREGQWRVKLIIACRSDKIGRDSDGRFRPEVEDRYSRQKLDEFQKAATASFTFRQINEYIEKYVAKHLQVAVRESSGGGQDLMQYWPSEIQPSSQTSRVWTVPQYKETLNDIPNLMELVKNPYILSFILKLLPAIAGSPHDVSRSRVSFDELYKYIFDNWMRVGKLRLYGKTGNSDDQQVFSMLMEDGFEPRCMEFLKDLAVKIFEKQGGDPVVEYVHLRHKNTPTSEWKTRFFGPDSESRLLLESVPLIKSGNYYRFAHPSLLQYLYSLAVFDPNGSGDDDDSDTGGWSSDDFDSDNSRGSGRGPVSRSNTLSLLEGGTASRQRKASQHVPVVEKEKDLEKGRALEEGHKLGLTDIAKRSMTVQFLADRVQNHQFFKEQLVETVRESRNNKGIDHTLAANAMTILVRSGMRFNSADLRGISIKGANLTGGEFDSADLRDADLTNVIFDKCWLRQADFQGAKLGGAQFGEKPLDLQNVPNTAAYSVDGTLYAVAFTNGSITIFDATNWNSIHTSQVSKKSVTALAFSPLGGLLAYGDRTGMLGTWNYSSEASMAFSSEHDDYINSLVYSPNGSQIATAGYDGKVAVWDAVTGGCVGVMVAHNEGASSVAFSPDGKQLVSGGFDMVLKLWNLETGSLVSTLEGHDGAISTVLFSPDGQHIASSSSDKSVRIWCASTGTWRLETICRGHSGRITSIAYSTDGQHLASGSDDNTVRTWDPRTGSSGPIFRGHTDQVVSVAYSQCGSQLVSCGRDKALRVWDCRAAVKGAVLFGRTNSLPSGMYPYSTIKRQNSDSDKPIQPTRPRPLVRTFCSESFGRNDTTCIAVSSDAVLVASASMNVDTPTINVSFGITLQHRYALNGHAKKISSITFSPDNQTIASGDSSGVLRVWNAQSGDDIWNRKEHNGKVMSIAYSLNGEHIVSSGEDGTVLLWKALTGDIVHSFDAEGCEVHCVAISSTSRWVAAGGEDEVVRLWDINSGDAGPVLSYGHRGTVNSVAFSPDGIHIASGGDDNKIRIWNIDTGTEVHVLKDHMDPVRCLAFSPSGERIVSGSEDCTMRIWNVATGVLESTSEHRDGVATVSFSSGGAKLWTGTNDYKVHSWVWASTGQETALTCTSAFSKDGQHVASSLGGNAVRLWDTDSGKPQRILLGHSETIESISFSPVGNFIATASNDSTIRVWDTATGECPFLLEGHSGIVTSVVFSPDGTQVATSGLDQTLRWWNLSVPGSESLLREGDGALVLQSEARASTPISVMETDKTGTSMDGTHRAIDGMYVHDDSGLFHAPVYSPDGNEISVISGEHGVLRFDTQSKVPRLALVGHTATATCIAYSPSGDMIATSSDDRTARIWDPVSGNELFKFEGHEDSVTSVAFSPLGHQLVTSSADKNIRLWNIAVNTPDQQAVGHVLLSHTAPVLCIAYSPDGRFLASGSEDRTMRLWDALTGDHLTEVKDFVVGVKTIQWKNSARGGMILVTGCKENPLRVWEVVEGTGRRYEVRRYWGAGVESLALSGTSLGQEHGLTEVECKMLG
ncbi:hypothetical protein EC957_005660 [Mortierella hygrophila]|uniref:AAA+ ATPase domain-containing protein n=1 Tax=Mortierella hygrophila TaxID=979708 RepID=A0A9P6FE43_9FUNG|nr:hypothetical protein EC957_005660 [Mortierella hygrophila]